MKKFFHLTPISVSTHSFTVFLCHRKKESFSEYLPIFIYGKASEREVNFSHLKNWVTKRWKKFKSLHFREKEEKSKWASEKEIWTTAGAGSMNQRKTQVWIS